jgi:hypothetical protein
MLFGAEARFPDVCECGWGGVPSGRPFLDLRASWRHYRTPPQLRRHTILMKTLVAVGVIGLLLGFGGGVLTGRLFPTHHFERYGESRYLLDSATGRVCDPMRNPNANPLDEALKTPQADSKDDPFAAYGGHLVQPTFTPPACGK